MTDAVSNSTPVVLLPDAGPLITLAYGQALDLLLKPNWPVRIVDMVLHEVTRYSTPSSEAIHDWVEANRVSIMTTRTYHHYQAAKRVFLSPITAARSARVPFSSFWKVKAGSTPQQRLKGR
ncbi:hypothetical protein Thiowin_00180 [Thiorhodovibrio winogradskyi]|uniref:Uncharacterized protein n=1 Tax=Thiorhodovibrio winogradskyi TaxID=77007 RepID=A0ABZ0S1V9_9GAMM|nr:hypothetical protein [Thiorhodovibrio winogradskyi]